jgi:hypothetical protein
MLLTEEIIVKIARELRMNDCLLGMPLRRKKKSWLGYTLSRQYREALIKLTSHSQTDFLSQIHYI